MYAPLSLLLVVSLPPSGDGYIGPVETTAASRQRDRLKKLAQRAERDTHAQAAARDAHGQPLDREQRLDPERQTVTSD